MIKRCFPAKKRSSTRLHRQCNSYDNARRIWRRIVYDQMEQLRDSPIHGVRQIVAPNRHILERVLWLLLVTLAMYATFYTSLIQYRRFVAQPTVVSMKRDFRNWTTNYPAITACFVAKTDDAKVDAYIQRIWNVSLQSDVEKYRYYERFVKLVAEISLRRNIRIFWDYKDDDSLKGVNLLEMAIEVYPEYYIETSGYSKGLSTDKSWTMVITEMGICSTFNSAYSKYQRLDAFDLPYNNSDYEPDKLLMCHYLNHQCYVRFTITANIEFLVHSPLDVVDGASSSTGRIDFKDEHDIAYKAVEIKAAPTLRAMTLSQRKCRYSDEPISDEIPAYSYGLCQMECRRRLAIMFCGCRPFFYLLGDGEQCDASGMACIGRNVEILSSLPKNLANCSCLPQCTEINYFAHTKKFIHWSKTNLQMGNELSGGNQSLALSFKRTGVMQCALLPPKIRLARNVMFTLQDLFASFGGNAALFLGVSLITILEMLLNMVLSFYYLRTGNIKQ